MEFSNTIAAISSSYGEAAIGIVRVSGEDSSSIFKKIFRSGKSAKNEPIMTGNANRLLQYGHIIDPKTEAVVDEVMAAYLIAPKTYTKEDMLEIYCHGGSVSAYRILGIILANGAVQAKKGEFTLRAFLNGRIDLSQAESIVDLVKAKTVRSFDSALSHLKGDFSQKVCKIADDLKQVIVQITVAVDYPEEDIKEISLNQIRQRTQNAINQIETIIAGANSGKLLRQGARLTIIGRPNVGKSSLMNLLLGESRAIVTDTAGTTRDTIEEQISIKGIPIRLTDTAGIRQTTDSIEQIGVERAKLAANTADLIILVLDRSSPITSDELELMEFFYDRPTIIVCNKSDLKNIWNLDDLLLEIDAHFSNAEFIETSMLDNKSKDLIINTIAKKLQIADFSDDLAANSRHLAELEKARGSLKDSLKIDSYDLIEIDLRSGLNNLGNITGNNVGQEVIDQIFSQFCLGK